MTSLGNPRSWVPYMNSKDCSQGICSLYCPQWCDVIYPPPPPPAFEFPDDDSSPSFSPLVIAVIGVLASAFLLVSYYTIISKYCGSRESSESENHETSVELEEDHNNPSLHEPWHAPTIGLEEALIKSITVCKYKKGDGLVEVTDCPVCLSEFQDDESVRLLPKCSHAFHLPCIDTWLKSHSSCPLCRASIFTFNGQVTAPVMELPTRNEISSENQHADEEVVAVVARRDHELDAVEEDGRTVPKTALRAFSDLGNLRGRHSVIEIRDEDYESIMRSVSMDHRGSSVLSVADVLHVNQEQEECSNGASTSTYKGSSSRGESGKSSYKRRVLHCVLSPIAMKRSFSSGRFSFSRNGRGRHGILPV
ncbi:hypothetical protein RJT34_06516 [Clitoria ternatea]|uniref:RING-type E3 ubiquitin transferase n=1 Tax=Clitoria ternatea TaxID=43366 RepID=A0AAN9K2D4_CLITE